MTKFQRTFYVLLIVFLSILSVSGTIALRNLLHLVLLGMLSFYVWLELRRDRDRVIQLAKAVPLPVILWCTYLLLFPLIAPDRQGALENLIGKGMWGESILTWILAWGAVLVLGVGRLGLWPLALASAVPVFIHLFLLVLAWAGVLQPAFYADPSLQQVGASMWSVLNEPALVQGAFKAFPMGFRGIEPMHGNLGYPASQAMCLALAIAFSSWRERDQFKFFKAVALISSCFFSVIIAQSRAAVYFSLLMIALSFFVVFLTKDRTQLEQPELKETSNTRTKSIVFTTSIAAVSLVLFLKVAAGSVLWYSMWDKLSLGFELDNPKTLLCDGFSLSLNEAVKSKHAELDQEYMQVLIDGLNGDGARVIMARAGVDLVLDHPWGLNGDRDAYQLRMEEACGHIPALNFAHAHNAWINMALGIGIIGVAFYALVLFTFSQSGWDLLSCSFSIGLGLLLLSWFWIIRAVVDAVFQEHYLQMQAFFIMYLYLCKFNKPKNFK